MQFVDFILGEALPQEALLEFVDKDLNILLEFVFILKLFGVDVFL